MSKLTGIVVVVTVWAAGCAEPRPFHERTMIDLTHLFEEATIFWPTEPGFDIETAFDGVTEAGFYYLSKRFCTPEHGGTHVDAPIHFHADRPTVDQLPVERLIGPGVRIDVSRACAQDADYLVGVEDLERWEAEHGRIPDGAIVLLDTGFGRFWPDRVRYMGTDLRGPEALAELHFPGLDPLAAAWLAGERTIGAVGLDTPSIDRGPSTGFESHVRLFRDGIPVLENVANLDSLPARGFTVIALPMKIAGGSGGPTRVVAVLD